MFISQRGHLVATATKETAEKNGAAKERDEALEGVLSALAGLAGATSLHQSVAAGIEEHNQTTYLKPKPATYREGEALFKRAAEEEEQREQYTHQFKYRPWDVALAFMNVCKATFGVAPVAHPGDSVQQEIATGLHTSVTIPYGCAQLLPLADAHVDYTRARDPRLGIVGVLGITTQKRLHPAARGLCLAVEEYLKDHSIYKGKAITSDSEPRFMDPWRATNAENIIWTRETDAALRGSLLNLIQFPGRAYDRGLPIHRTVLFEGEPGNGKSETINIVAQMAVANGFTSITVTTDLKDALTQARMYAPSVIFFEDLEQLVNDATAEEMSALLEELDGASTKGHDIMLVATTNFIEDLRKTVRRRMAKVITFGPFDAEASARYLRVVLKGQAEPDFDYEEVAAGMDGWGNSYIAKAVEFAKGLALSHESPMLRTVDLLDAIKVIDPEWQAYNLAKARPEPPRFDTAFKEVMVEAVTSGAVRVDMDNSYELVKAK